MSYPGKNQPKIPTLQGLNPIRKPMIFTPFSVVEIKRPLLNPKGLESSSPALADPGFVAANWRSPPLRLNHNETKRLSNMKTRKIRIFEHISLDGVIQPPGDSDFANGGWTTPYRTPAGAAALAEAQGASFDLLLGRRTYDLWAAFWPKAGNNPMADALNAAIKYVATHKPESLRWGPVADLGADILEGIRRIKSTHGPDLIVWGSSTLTSVLLDQGLADEVVLIIYPVLLGRGKRFFSEIAAPQELAFDNTQATPSGVLINTYRHVGSLQTKSSAAPSG
jgi:dihydrofolate reductase